VQGKVVIEGESRERGGRGDPGLEWSSLRRLVDVSSQNSYVYVGKIPLSANFPHLHTQFRVNSIISDRKVVKSGRKRPSADRAYSVFILLMREFCYDRMDKLL
jgi:hypothetical protein